MIDASKFVKDHIPLCICTLGIAILGYLGYHVVRWIISKCYKTEKIDQVAQKIIGSMPQPVTPFEEYMVDLNFSNGRKQIVPIHHLTDVETMLKTISDEIHSHHITVELYFAFPANEAIVTTRMESFQKLPVAQALQFITSSYVMRTIVVQPKPIERENLGEGKMRQTYANGVSEEFIFNDHYYEGTRIFPDGRREKGEFHKESGNLISGYRIEIDGKIEFINPKSFASYKEVSEKRELEIYDVDGKLVVLEKTWNEDYRGKYAITDIPVETVLLKSIQKPSYGDGESIKNVLSHKSFNENRRRFIDHILAADESGTPRLFGLSNFAALDVIEMGSRMMSLNPLEIVDPVSGRNFMTQAAHWGSAELLNKLIDLFSRDFLSVGQSVIAELLIQGHPIGLVNDVIEQFKKLGGVLDTHHSLWMQVAQMTKPDETFREQFSLMSTDQKRKLYDSAFVYNNPFIHEPSDPPISANQYSINLMWINKNKIPEDQEFLFGNGASNQERTLDFHVRFTEPVSKWALANPGCRINIWVDSEMATSQAIERSRRALENALKGKAHGHISFRDVRTMDVVRVNPKVFSESMPIYFRVDLLRAIAADYTLMKKETQFFVYGDIDMEPLSANEIFDKRTVHFLNDFGFVMAKGGWLGFENGFQILNGNHSQLMDSHRKVIINLSVEMALEKPNKINPQQVYDTYPAMITHFLNEDGRYGKLKKRVQLKYFRYDEFETSAHRVLPLGEGHTELEKIVPTKPVRLPPTHF